MRRKSKVGGHSTGVFGNGCCGINLGPIPTSHWHHGGSERSPLLPVAALNTPGHHGAILVLQQPR